MNNEEQIISLMQTICGAVVKLQSSVIDMHEEMKEIRADITTMKSEITLMKSEIIVMKSEMSEMKSDIATLKSEMSEMKSDIATLKSEMSEMKSDIATLKSEMIEVKQGQQRLETIIETEIKRNIQLLAESYTLHSDALARVDDKITNLTDTLDVHEVELKILSRKNN